jgi:hypothetical protein
MFIFVLMVGKLMQQVLNTNTQSVMDNTGIKPVNSPYSYYPQVTQTPVNTQNHETGALPGADYYNGVKQSFVPSAQKQPSASVGAVNIQIYNPTVTPGCNTSVSSIPVTPPAQGISQQQAPVTIPQVTNQDTQQPAAASNIKDEENKKDSKTKKKDIMIINDDYVKTLENHLNNSNADVRYMGMKELFERFKEDDSRKTDLALTSLLNKALQDKSSKVRFLALTTLNAGYAAGDQLTVDILKQMQKTDSVYNQDALTASQALLKMVGNNLDKRTVEVPAAELKSNSTKENKGGKLNVVSTGE